MSLIDDIKRDSEADTDAPCHVCKGKGYLLSQARYQGPITSEACWHCSGTGQRTTKVMREPNNTPRTH